MVAQYFQDTLILLLTSLQFTKHETPNFYQNVDDLPCCLSLAIWHKKIMIQQENVSFVIVCICFGREAKKNSGSIHSHSVCYPLN